MIKYFFIIAMVLFLNGCQQNKQPDVYVENTLYKSVVKETIKENTTDTQKNIDTEKEVGFNPIITPEAYKKMIAQGQELQSKEAEESVDMNKALMDFYNEWKHVKYRLGGNSKRGIDCSAFTQRIFKEKFDVKIPRTTRTQVKVGKKVKKSELELGDLVFFKTGKTDRHVGIYMGNGDFMHASIKGVKFTKLNKPFYVRTYWTSRRIID